MFKFLSIGRGVIIEKIANFAANFQFGYVTERAKPRLVKIN